MVKLIRLFRELLGKFRRILIYQINRLSSIRHVNLGGGPWFAGFRWYNLETVTSRVNPDPFIFSPECIFPFPDNSVHTVYNSHNLEHLNQLTVNRVLTEAHRILKPGGNLLIKLPDFDQILESWKKRDSDYFKRFILSPADDTWKNRNVSNNIDNRAAFTFCGFWNDEYGDHFSGKISNNSMAYHGPPVMSAEKLNQVLMCDSPHMISKKLCGYVVENESSYTFNHQNAWSRDELKELITQKHFKVISTDAEHIIREYSFVPGVRFMEEISMYILAERGK